MRSAKAVDTWSDWAKLNFVNLDRPDTAPVTICIPDDVATKPPAPPPTIMFSQLRRAIHEIRAKRRKRFARNNNPS